MRLYVCQHLRAERVEVGRQARLLSSGSLHCSWNALLLPLLRIISAAPTKQIGWQHGQAGHQHMLCLLRTAWLLVLLRLDSCSVCAAAAAAAASYGTAAGLLLPLLLHLRSSGSWMCCAKHGILSHKVAQLQPLSQSTPQEQTCTLNGAGARKQGCWLPQLRHPLQAGHMLPSTSIRVLDRKEPV